MLRALLLTDMDINFFESFEEPLEKAPAEMAGYIQILNISGSIIPVVEGWYLRTHKCAFVHPDNLKVQKLLKLRRVREIPFTIDKTKKKKPKQITQPPSESVKEMGELKELENLFANPVNTEAGEETFAK